MTKVTKAQLHEKIDDFKTKLEDIDTDLESGDTDKDDYERRHRILSNLLDTLEKEM